MRDRELYRRILGIERPWQVTEVELSLEAGEVKVHVAVAPGAELACPVCGRVVPRYDRRYREWRHLDTCQFRTIVAAEVPRVSCPEHGVRQVAVPWAEAGSGYTALFEALVIDWLREASIEAVRRRLGLSWNAIAGIMHRAVRRGLGRRGREAGWCRRLGVDETAFRRRHDYVTVVSDRERDRVLYVADGRRKESLEGFYAGLTGEQKGRIESIAMDMWQPYIAATLEAIPGAAGKIAFDKFHVAKHLGEAVDQVRRREHRELLRQGIEVLKGTRYAWLTNPRKMNASRRRGFAALTRSALKTARAWAIKELAMSLWGYTSRTWAAKAWARWYGWAIRSRLEPVKRVARMIKEHRWGIINAIVLKADNGHAESINSRIQLIKARSRGFRNRERFRMAIYFHLGGLDLYPEGVR